jgi:hypothetical protein
MFRVKIRQAVKMVEEAARRIRDTEGEGTSP